MNYWTYFKRNHYIITTAVGIGMIAYSQWYNQDAGSWPITIIGALVVVVTIVGSRIAYKRYKNG